MGGVDWFRDWGFVYIFLGNQIGMAEKHSGWRSWGLGLRYTRVAQHHRWGFKYRQRT